MAACFLCVRRGQVCRAHLEAYEMYLIRTDTTDPAYNLAAEEFLLKQKRGDIFYLWRNKPSIIIGKTRTPTAKSTLITYATTGFKWFAA